MVRLIDEVRTRRCRGRGIFRGYHADQIMILEGKIIIRHYGATLEAEVRRHEKAPKVRGL